MARTTGSDDVQVIERADFNKPLTEESLIAEADRLAIEAVRRAEEARGAAQRAERKAAMAKLASDAAMIASDAVRLIGVSGLQAALARLDEARQIEQRMARGAVDTSASGRIPAYDGPVSAPPASLSQGGGGWPAQGHGAPGNAPPPAPSNPHGQPPPPRPSFFPQAYEGNPGSLPLPPHVSRSPSMAPQPQPSMPPQASMAPPPAPQPQDLGFDDEAFRARLKPTLFGLPPVAIAALGIVAFCLAFLILWFLFA